MNKQKNHMPLKPQNKIKSTNKQYENITEQWIIQQTQSIKLSDASKAKQWQHILFMCTMTNSE